MIVAVVAFFLPYSSAVPSSAGRSIKLSVPTCFKYYCYFPA